MDKEWANIAESILNGNTPEKSVQKIHENATRKNLPVIGDNIESIEVSPEEVLSMIGEAKANDPYGPKEVSPDRPSIADKADQVIKNFGKQAKKVRNKKYKDNIHRVPKELRKKVTKKDKRSVIKIIKAKQQGKFNEERVEVKRPGKKATEFVDKSVLAKQKSKERAKNIANSLKGKKRKDHKTDPVYGLKTEGALRLKRRIEADKKKSGVVSQGVKRRRDSNIKYSNQRALKKVRSKGYRGTQSAQDLHQTARDLSNEK